MNHCNNKLAIAIPTYNRAEILIENLEAMLPDLQEFKICVYISDDSTNNETETAIQKFQLRYPYVHYKKNTPGLGHDRNCLSTLGMPNETFVWYLGDAQIITPGAIGKVLDVIDEDEIDFICVNSANRDLSLASRKYTDPNLFFVDLAWHATMTGVTVYRREILFKHDYNPYIQSNFMQLGILLEELAESKKGILWINENMISGNRNKGDSYWMKSAFKVFASDWSKFILKLPNLYTTRNKKSVIKSHSDHTGLFKLKSLLLLRSQNVLTLNSYLTYFKPLRLASSMNVYLVSLLLVIPPGVLKQLRKVRPPQNV